MDFLKLRFTFVNLSANICPSKNNKYYSVTYHNEEKNKEKKNKRKKTIIKKDAAQTIVRKNEQSKQERHRLLQR